MDTATITADRMLWGLSRGLFKGGILLID